MSTETIVRLLTAELDKINRAINALNGPTKRRGRPPKISADGQAAPSVPRKRRKRTSAQRKAQAERMRAYWAKRRKQS